MGIAVLLDIEGKTSGFEKDGIIRVFSKQDNAWILQRERAYNINEINSASEMRRYLSEVGDWLSDCRSFVVKRMRGVHLAAFESLQVSFWEIDGFPENYFDCIQQSQNQQAVQTQAPPEEIAKPVEQKPGYYFVDLRDIMSHKTALSSKTVLKPFLKETNFVQLEIVCNHVPKWFESELPDLNLRTEIKIGENSIRVLLFPAKQQKS